MNRRETLKSSVPFSLSDAMIEVLLHYLDLLHHWNKAYNLTAIRDIDAMIPRHVADSLAIAPWVQGDHVLDVGSGAGLPGIPLAICDNKRRYTLLDSQGKRIRFLQEVKRVLNLEHVDIVQTRIEAYIPQQKFDTIVSRAFSDITQFIQLTQPVIAEQGIWLAMKGQVPLAELTDVLQPYVVKTYTVNGLEGKRCCIIIQNSCKKGRHYGENNSHYESKRGRRKNNDGD